MQTTLRTRKPIDDLTIADLEAYPVWESDADEAGDDDEHDDTWVRPVDTELVPAGASSLSVAADFTAADGTTYIGFVGMSTDHAVAIACAALLANGGCVTVSNGMQPEPGERTWAEGKLGKPQEQIYPLQFTLRVCVAGETTLRSGIFG